MIGKKGAEMTIGTLVVIVLAVLVLAFVAYGFSTGWTNLWNQISPKVAKINVDSLRDTCQYACATQQTYQYCCINRTIVYQAGAAINTTSGTCTSSLITPSGCSMPCPESVCAPATSP